MSAGLDQIYRFFVVACFRPSGKLGGTGSRGFFWRLQSKGVKFLQHAEIFVTHVKIFEGYVIL